MEEIRKKFDQIDREIIELLGKRMKLSQKAGQYKKEAGIKIHQPEREKELLHKLSLLAEKKAVPIKLINEIYQAIFKESKNIQLNDN